MASPQNAVPHDAEPDIPRQTLDIDIACVGFGPAMGGFLTTVSKGLAAQEARALEAPDENPPIESSAMPGMPPQIVCYERADDLGFGVSGVVTRARGLRATFPDFDPSQIPLAQKVSGEKVAYLLDPHGASRRPWSLRVADRLLKLTRRARHQAFELPWIPEFLGKEDGIACSIGQFNQWVAGQVMMEGRAQLWPGTPVDKPLLEADRVAGVRLVDQGRDADGTPGPAFMPGMDVKADLTVVADGPVGPIGRALDEHFGLPEGHEQDDWAVGMKVVVDLPEGCELQPGTVLHTLGYPEPEIFGFLYVQEPGVASLGIFVPSWFDSPVRATYRYLQHWMQHPWLWRHLQGGTLRSWGAKSLQESGRRGEPRLCGDGYARIGEGSGSTNVLTGSGVDEAWATGSLLGEAVLELLRAKEPFTQANLERTYVARRRQSWVEKEARIAEKARDGFRRGVVRGLLGMGLTGLSGGRINAGRGRESSADGHKRARSLEQFYKGRIPAAELATLRKQARDEQRPLHDLLMTRAGWPDIEHDGQLLISHQDALLRGGKVQAPPGYADHITFLYPSLCESCETQVCIEVCSAQALSPAEGGGVPDFDREKCVHCGACQWTCDAPREDGRQLGNVVLRAGAGGLHSAEN